MPEPTFETDSNFSSYEIFMKKLTYALLFVMVSAFSISAHAAGDTLNALSVCEQKIRANFLDDLVKAGVTGQNFKKAEEETLKIYGTYKSEDKSFELIVTSNAYMVHYQLGDTIKYIVYGRKNCPDL